MKKIFTTCALLILLIDCNNTYSQTPTEEYCIGGSNAELWKDIFLTEDSGKILIMETSSNNYDITNSFGGKDIFLLKFNKEDRLVWKKNVGTAWNDNYVKLYYSKNKTSYFLTYAAANNSGDTIKKVVSRIDLNGNILFTNSDCIPKQAKYRISSTFNGSTFRDSGFVNHFDLFSDINDNVYIFDAKLDSNSKTTGIYSIKLSNSGGCLINKFLPINFNPYLYNHNVTYGDDFKQKHNFITSEYNNTNNFAMIVELSNFSGIDLGNAYQSRGRSYLYLFNNLLDTIGFKSLSTITSAEYPTKLLVLPNGNFFIDFNRITSSYVKVFLDGNLNLLNRHATYPPGLIGFPKYYVIDSMLYTTSDGSLSDGSNNSKILKFNFNGDLRNTFRLNQVISNSNIDLIQNNTFVYNKKFNSGSFIDSIFGIDLNNNVKFAKPVEAVTYYNNISCNTYADLPENKIKKLNNNSISTHYLLGTSATYISNIGLLGRLLYNNNGDIIDRKLGLAKNVAGTMKYYNFNTNTYTLYGSINYSACNIPDQQNLKLEYYNYSNNIILGKTYIDNNNNNIYNPATDILFTQGYAKSIKGNINAISYLNGNGQYLNFVDTGTYNTIFTGYNNYYTVLPVTKTTTHTTYGNLDTVDFALKPKGSIKDLRVSLVNNWVTRPGFTNSYEAVYVNEGTTVVSNASVAVVLDNRLTYNNAVPSPTAIVGDTLKWNLASLNPSQQGKIVINFTGKTPPTLNGNDSLLSKAIIYPVVGDTTPVDNRYTLTDIARNAFDPNDKNIETNSTLTPAQVTSGDYITYRVRFQNTGNFYATNVIIRDTLESNLDWSSLQVIAASHSGLQTSIQSNNVVEFRFNNINLPASSVSEAASHGYIVFKIKPKNTLVAGNTIKNKAHITFDFNTPIKTNIATAKVVTITATINKHNTIGELNLFPNPNNGNFTVDFTSKGNYPITVTLFDVTGKVVYLQTMQHNDRSLLQISDAVLASGLYNLQISGPNEVWNKKVLITK